jgi:D-serine deaminase-like pyridoxal phosphate-dependent protein
MATLADIPTPALVLELPRLRQNAEFMAGRAAALGVKLRPHMKTAKSVDVARIVTAGQAGGITVSTLAEARYFHGHGVSDITLAVELPPTKVPEVQGLTRQGARLTVLVDSLDAAQALPADAKALIEIDCGDGRGGMAPDSPLLLGIAEVLGQRLAGVLTHAGHSYACRSTEAIADVAEQERAAAVFAAGRLRQAGFACDTVSVGSTPTATHARNFDGVTEMRPGVYMLGDLDQVGLGSLPVQRVACSVLATVIGHYPQRSKLLIDAGGLALSKDVSAQRHGDAIGYGLVCGMDGAPLPGVHVASTSQEHGHVKSTGTLPFAELPIGSRVRVLPNHVCMTAAAHPGYHVVDGGAEIIAFWPRVNGW